MWFLEKHGGIIEEIWLYPDKLQRQTAHHAFTQFTRPILMFRDFVLISSI